MIAREGRVAVGIALLGALWSLYAGAKLLTALALAVFALLVWLYASPRRKAPAVALGLLCPVDGRVTRVEPYRDPWLERDALRIGIALTPPGWTVLYSVTEGTIKGFWTKRGAFGEGRLKRSLDASPDCYALQVQTDEGDDVVLAVSSRWPVSRCRFDRSPGERVGQGIRFGFFYFASTADVLAPPGSAPLVAVGDRVRAVSTVLAKLAKK
jgi:phosphatidylserine decarboxylase